MARIRTIKPEFFRHEGLFEAEKKSGLPLRVAYAGMFTAADREGRFKWSPRNLKLDCLPYDDVDFGAILDALFTFGFIIKYEINGETYGAIPSWKSHQHVNVREKASEIPEPTDESMCRHHTRRVRSRGEGKGREGKGTDNSTVANATRAEEEFKEFWKAYPKREGSNRKSPAEKSFWNAVKRGTTPAEIIIGAKKFAEREATNVGTRFIPMATTWLNERGWEEFKPDPADEERRRQLYANMEAKGWRMIDGKWTPPGEAA